MMETVTVGELIRILEEYPSTTKVYYSTRYALTPIQVRMIADEFVVVEMTDESKKLLTHQDY